jgi:exosome complex RNA-binding protein Csl4
MAKIRAICDKCGVEHILQENKFRCKECRRKEEDE